MTPSDLFSAGALRLAAWAGYHAAKGEEDEAKRCALAAREEENAMADAIRRSVKPNPQTEDRS